MKIKLLVVLMIGSSITGSIYGIEAGLQNINMHELNAKIINTAKQLQPVLQNLAEGNFDELGDELDKNPLDLTQTIRFLIDNMDNFKNGLLATLPKIPYDQIPKEYQEEVHKIANDVAANIGNFDQIKNGLPKLLPYANITAMKDTIIPVLALLPMAPGYDKVGPKLLDIYNNGIKPGVDMLANATDDPTIRKKAILNLATLEAAIDPLKRQLVLVDLPKIAGGLVQFKKLVPAITGTLAGTLGLVLALNEAISNLAAMGRPVTLPAPLAQILANIQKNAATITRLINMLNTKVDEAIAQLAKQLKGGG